MKQIFTILFFLLVSLHTSAQDVIVMKNGNTIVSKILEITTTEVKYKKFSNQDGPTYTVLKSELKGINYANGDKDVFETAPVAQPTIPSNNPNTSLSYSGGNYNTETTSSAPYTGINRLESQMPRVNPVPEGKIKAFKILGWIGGGVMVGTGIGLMVAGLINMDGDSSKSSYSYYGYTYKYNDDSYIALLASGGACIAAGAAWTTIFLVRAGKLRRQNEMSLNTAPLLQHEFTLKNGSKFMAGVDMMRDTKMNDQTLGIGLRYNF